MNSTFITRCIAGLLLLGAGIALVLDAMIPSDKDAWEVGVGILLLVIGVGVIPPITLMPTYSVDTPKKFDPPSHEDVKAGDHK
jgi:hypothetical protein